MLRPNKYPRNYQEAAHEATWNYIHNSPTTNPLIVEATGLGKSLNIAMFITHILHVYPHVRIMQLAHVKELVAGNYAELMEFWPTAPAGVYAAGLGMKDTHAQATFAMIQSVAERPATFGKIDFVLIDEAHLISDNDGARYVRFIKALKKRNPHLIVIGYTATAFRMTTGLLTNGKLFDEIIYDVGSGESFLWAIEQGYLIRPVPKDPGFQLDSNDISITGGDFNTSETNAAMLEQNLLERAVDQSIQMATEQGRKCWLTFNQSIEHAELVADMFTYKGYPHEAVHSKRDDRDEVIKAFKEGGLVGVTNKDIMTTGTNVPAVDMIVGLRLTRSPGLWVQMIGRGTRPNWTGHIGHNGGPPLHNINTFEGRWASILASSKQSCLVLDYCGNTERLGPINYPNVPKRRKKGVKGAPVVKKCPECSTYFHPSVMVCTECGYEFSPPSRLHNAASDSDLVQSQVLDLENLPPPSAPVYNVYTVHEMTATHHHGKIKKDRDGNIVDQKKDTMKVTYRSGFHSFSTWVCIEHHPDSFPFRKADDWWKQHMGENIPLDPHGDAILDVPQACDLVGQGAQAPKFIKVMTSKEFPEITEFDFKGTQFVLDLSGGEATIFPPEPDPMEGILKAQAEQDENMKNVFSGGGYYDEEIPFAPEWRI